VFTRALHPGSFCPLVDDEIKHIVKNQAIPYWLRVCLFVADLMTLSLTWTNNWMAVNNELERTRKEEVVAYFKVL
jgi:hypothetical protein